MARRKRNHCLICLEIRTLYLVIVIVNEGVVYQPNPFPILSATEIGVEVGASVCLLVLFGIGKKPLGYFTRNRRENKRAEMGTSGGVWFWGMLAAVILLGLSNTGRSDDTSGEETKPEVTTEEEGGWICAVGFMEEEELYIDEWLAYHRILGFDYFFLCDGGNNASLGDFLRTHAEAGYVAVGAPWPHSTADHHVGGCLKLALEIMQASTYFFISIFLRCEIGFTHLLIY